VEPVLAHVGDGTFAPLQILPLAIAAVLYVRRASTLAKRGKPVPLWRQICFGSGVALIIAALVTPVAHMGNELLLAHMGQHLAIGDLAPLLMVLGLTGPLLQPILSIKFFDRLRILAHPLVALPLWAVNLYVWHIPVLYQAALSSEAVHALEHMFFISAGLLMWMPLFGPLPKPAWFGLPAALGYIVGVRLLGTVLGNVFMWSTTDFYPDYASGREFWEMSAITDQGVAGVIMTIEGGFVTLGVLSWLFLIWAKQDTEKQKLLDLADREGVDLDPARAERAVASGQGARLEERLRS
jgi:cytochrome c oxidase assembly factor CtaG